MNVITAFCIRLIAAMYGNIVVELLLVAVCADMLFGSMRACKERCWNSAVGIDGAVRKAGMVASIVLFSVMDMILHIDLFSWLPVDARNTLNAAGIVKAGCTELFGILYILYEATSVLKNMLLCGLPVPAGIREKLGNWLKDMTDETNAQLTAEGHHMMVPAHLDDSQLATMTEGELRNMALEMGLSIKPDATKDGLIQLLCAETVYI